MKVPAVAVLLAAGALLSLSFPEPDIAPLAWVSLVPLLLVARRGSVRRGFLCGFVFGLGFFGALLVWVGLIGWIGWAVLVALQAVFIGTFAAAWASVARRAGLVERVLAAVALWIVLEYVRSIVPVGGFPWGQLAQSQHNLSWMLRPAALGGGWLVGGIVVAVNALLAEAAQALIARRSVRGVAVPAAIAGLLLVAPLAIPANEATGEEIDLAIVQGNVPREIPEGFERDQAILDSHRRLTEELADEKVDLVLWPESAIPYDLDTTPEAQVAVGSAAVAARSPMIVGGNLDAGPDNYKVMAFEVSADGTVTDRYQKTHLVPFGEYVPARALFGWIPMLDQVPTDALRGDRIAVFDVAGGPVAPVISFEGDFGSLVRTRIDAGGRLLTVLTNTSTWGDTWASAQHVAFSQVRAAENGVWVAHAAVSGISAFIAPDGSVEARIPLWTADSALQTVRFAEDITLYARVGDWVPLLAALASAWFLGRSVRRRRTV